MTRSLFFVKGIVIIADILFAIRILSMDIKRGTK